MDDNNNIENSLKHQNISYRNVIYNHTNIKTQIDRSTRLLRHKCQFKMYINNRKYLKINLKINKTIHNTC